MKRILSLTPLAVLAILLLAGGSAEAGSVFLKNGYIIQGRIVEHDVDKVVVGYANGRVIIYDRFIDEVLLDPSEEEALQEERRERQGEEVDPVVVAEHVTLHLPANLAEIIPLHDDNLTALLDGTTNAVSPGSGRGSTPLGDELPSARVQVPPVDPSVVDLQEVGVALCPPQGWRVERAPGRVQFRGGEGLDHPSLTIQTFPAAGIDLETAHNELRRALESGYPGVEIVAEREGTVGRTPARVIVGNFPDQRLSFTQAIVQRPEVLYLFGMQLTTPVDPEKRAMLEESLRSMRFLDE
ncbi:MAG: hypothetical protein ACE5GW_04930 [Planctomycetota bacterium]